MNIIQSAQSNTLVHKQANQALKAVKELFEEFNKIANKTVKYDKLRHGGKYSYLYNKDQGDIVDMLAANPKRGKNPYLQENPDVSSKSLKLFSSFS